MNFLIPVLYKPNYIYTHTILSAHASILYLKYTLCAFIYVLPYYFCFSFFVPGGQCLNDLINEQIIEVSGRIEVQLTIYEVPVQLTSGEYEQVFDVSYRYRTLNLQVSHVRILSCVRC